MRNFCTQAVKYIYLIATFTSAATFITACNDNHQATASNPALPKKYALPLPVALQAVNQSARGILSAYASVDSGPFLAMSVTDNTTEFTFTNLTSGQHTIRIKFNFKSTQFTNNNRSDGTFTIANADITLNLTAGINRRTLTDSDIKYNIDDDNDGIVNIKELTGGTDPGNSPNTPTILSRNTIYVSQKTFFPLVNIQLKDPTDDPVTLTIGGPLRGEFIITNGDTITLAFNDNKLNNKTLDVSNLTITASDGVYESVQDLKVSIVHFLAADNGIHGIELWRSDGTTHGTEMVKDINPTGHSSPEQITVMKNGVFFSAYDEERGRELWQSDGSVKGTRLVKDINTSGDAGPSNMFVLGDWLYFSAFNGLKTVLYKTDGSTTTEVKSNNNSSLLMPTSLTDLNGELFFSAYITNNLPAERQLWRYSETTSGAIPVESSSAVKFYNPENLVAANGNLLFVAHRSNANNNGLWITDGSSAQTSLLTDSFGGYGISSAKLVDWNGIVYFAANEGINGVELWRSDGMTDGTRLLYDLNIDTTASSGANNHSHPHNIISSNDTLKGNRLYFAATDGSNPRGAELWRMIDEMTFPVLADADIGQNIIANPKNLTSTNGVLYFSTWWSGLDQRVIARDEGVLLLYGLSFLSNEQPLSLTAVNTGVYYSAFIADIGRELARIDGPTTDGVELIANINKLPRSSIEDITGMAALYDFNDGSGSTVSDVSGIGAPSSLNIANIENVEWVTGGLKLKTPTHIHSAGSFTKAIKPIKSTDALSVEVWLSADTNNRPISNLVSIGNSSTDRNLAIQQRPSNVNGSIHFQTKLRSSETYADGQSKLITLNASENQLQQQLVHLVYSRQSDGTAALYINGNTTPNMNIWPGSFDTWSNDMPLNVAGDVHNLEPWLGTLYRLAIYNCALSSSQIDSNYQAGSEATIQQPVSCQY